MKYLLTLVILAAALSSFGQAAKPVLITAAGDNFSSAGKQITWSLGEVLVETYSKGNISLTQGFHQGNYLVTAMDESVLSGMEIKAYPNPATDFITVQITGSKSQVENYVIDLTDIQGKLLLKINPDSDSPKVNLQSYGAGTYFLSVSEKGKILRTFKVIKLK